MAKKVTQWVSDDGKSYDSELAAVYADYKFWKKKAEELQKILDRRKSDQPQSGYGSSGGGGHD